MLKVGRVSYSDGNVSNNCVKMDDSGMPALLHYVKNYQSALRKLKNRLPKPATSKAKVRRSSYDNVSSMFTNSVNIASEVKIPVSNTRSGS